MVTKKSTIVKKKSIQSVQKELDKVNNVYYIVFMKYSKCTKQVRRRTMEKPKVTIETIIQTKDKQDVEEISKEIKNMTSEQKNGMLFFLQGVNFANATRKE